MIYKMFKWIAHLHGKDKTVACVVAEWHCFWNGVSETFCFCIPPRILPTALTMQEMHKEWHYYNIGRGVGVAIWTIIIISIVIAKLP